MESDGHPVESDERRAPRGALTLCGSDPWLEPAGLLEHLLEAGGGEMVLLPTAAAYERPQRAIAAATARVAALGGRLSVCPVLTRGDAGRHERAEEVRGAGTILLSDGSPLHLRSVLKDSTVLAALVAAWHEGAALAASGGAATALSDPMIDPRGGAFSVGLGLLREMAVVTGPAAEERHASQLARTLALAPRGCALAAIPASSALVRDPDGHWHAEPRPAEAFGAAVRVYLDGLDGGLAALAGKPTA